MPSPLPVSARNTSAQIRQFLRGPARRRVQVSPLPFRSLRSPQDSRECSRPCAPQPLQYSAIPTAERTLRRSLLPEIRSSLHSPPSREQPSPRARLCLPPDRGRFSRDSLHRPRGMQRATGGPLRDLRLHTRSLNRPSALAPEVHLCQAITLNSK